VSIAPAPEKIEHVELVPVDGPDRSAVRAISLLLAVGIGLTLVGLLWIGVSIPSLIAGLGDMRNLLERMLPPTFKSC
jgi:hypothetical protein